MKTSAFFILAFTLILFSCNDGDKKTSETTSSTEKEPSMLIKSDSIIYYADSIKCIGYASVDTASKDKKAIVLILPEWWGVGDYVKTRSVELAKLGYFAMVADVYGNGTYAEDPTKAQALSAPFHTDFQLQKKRFDAALAEAKKSPYADTNRIAAIGYCFGGGIVLNIARMGENLNGVVSFHGDLVGVTPEKGKTMAMILVCHGEADNFVGPEQVATFKKQMDSVGEKYTFMTYPNATHAFTNPDATRLGKKFNMPIEYNAKADTASWNDMKSFFKTIF